MTLREDTLGVSAKRRAGSKVDVVTEGEKVEYLYLSADNHMDVTWYPKDIIQSRIAAKYRDAAPKVVETDAGTQGSGRASLVRSRLMARTGPSMRSVSPPLTCPRGHSHQPTRKS